MCVCVAENNCAVWLPLCLRNTIAVDPINVVAGAEPVLIGRGNYLHDSGNVIRHCARPTERRLTTDESRIMRSTVIIRILLHIARNRLARRFSGMESLHVTAEINLCDAANSAA